MALIAIIVSVISASYYLKIIRVLYTESTEENKEDLSLKKLILKNLKLDINISNLHSFLISTLTLFILLFVLKPSILLNSTQLLSLSLFNF